MKEFMARGFMARHAARITCALSGFDRLVLHGLLLPLIDGGRGSFSFLTRTNVRSGCSTA